MADLPISGLPNQAQPVGTDLGVLVDSGITKKFTMNTLGKAVGPISQNQIVPLQELASFGSPAAAAVHEKGVTVVNPVFNWTYNRAPDPTSQSINNGIGAVAVNLRTKTQIISLTSTVTYTITAVGDDGTPSNLSITISFVYPYYYGSGAQNLSGAQIGALTKLVDTFSNQFLSFSPTNQVPYFAYPATYPNLTSILDPSGFETISDWTLRNPVVITGLDATPQNYKVYEFNNLTTQVGFNYTFKY